VAEFRLSAILVLTVITDDDLDDLAHEIAIGDTELAMGRITQEGI